jgi:hypothetical protein
VEKFPSYSEDIILIHGEERHGRILLANDFIAAGPEMADGKDKSQTFLKRSRLNSVKTPSIRFIMSGEFRRDRRAWSLQTSNVDKLSLPPALTIVTAGNKRADAQ